MVKFLKLILIMFFAVLLMSCSRHEMGIILFNSVPITENNALHDQKVFREGSKVYYLFIAPKKMSNEFIRVQVFKMTDKAAIGASEVVRTKDYRLMRDERFYHTNYFTLYEKGRYVMQVFSHENFNVPLAINEFTIK